MTSSKLARSGMSQSLVQVGLGTVSIAMLCVCGVSVQQPPQDEIPKMQQKAVIPPNLSQPPSAPTEDFKNDPLFLEIQKIVQSGVKDSASGPSITTTDSLTSSRWHGVESILAAARMLEQDVADSLARNDIEEVARIQKAIRNLRAQALELLH